MKITKADISVIDIPLKEPWIMARVQINNVVALIIQLHTDDGLVGIGSARVGEGLTHENIEAMKSAAEIYIAPALIGCDPIDINDWTERLKRALRRGYTITKSGFEIALYDLIGKKMGRPLADVLGGTWHKEV